MYLIEKYFKLQFTTTTMSTPEDEEIPEENDENNLNKDASPFKDLMATLEKPADLTGAKK